MGVVNAAIGILGGGLSAIFAHHAQAVKAEAASLNAAFPAWRQELEAVVQAYNDGQISANDALGYLDQAKQTYYQYVRQIIKGQPPAGGCRSIDPSGATCPAPTLNPCNGPCSIAWYVIETEWFDARQAIKQTEQTGAPVGISGAPVPPHAGFSGGPAFSIQAQKPSGASGLLNSVGGGQLANTVEGLGTQVASALEVQGPNAGLLILGALAFVVVVVLVGRR